MGPRVPGAVQHVARLRAVVHCRPGTVLGRAHVLARGGRDSANCDRRRVGTARSAPLPTLQIQLLEPDQRRVGRAKARNGRLPHTRSVMAPCPRSGASCCSAPGTHELSRPLWRSLSRAVPCAHMARQGREDRWRGAAAQGLSSCGARAPALSSPNAPTFSAIMFRNDAGAWLNQVRCARDQ
jgi:hypothetical protein